MIFQLGIGGFLGGVRYNKINLAGCQKSFQPIGGLFRNSYLDGRILLHKPGEDSGQDDSSQVACDADMNASCFHIIDIADLQFEILVHFQNLKSHMIIFFTGIRQGKPGRGPVKQRGSQTVFNPFNILAEGRLGDKKLFGGLGYAFLICYCFDINQFPLGHLSLLSIIKRRFL